MKRKVRTLADYLEQDNAPTQEALAARLRITRAYVSMIAGGKRQPSLGLALRIQSITGVPAASLLLKREVA